MSSEQAQTAAMPQTQPEAVSLLARIREVFGMTAGELRTEYPKLTQKDKEDLVEAFNTSGLPTFLKA